MHLRILIALLLTAAVAVAQPGTRERGRFSLQGDPATGLAIDPAVKHVAIAFNGGTICVFPADQRVVYVVTHPIHKKAVTGVAFLPDGKTFVTVSLDGTLKTWSIEAALKYLKESDVKGGTTPGVPKPLRTVTAHSRYGVTALAVSPDGRRFATGATDGSVKLWDADTLKQTASLAVIHTGGVRAVQFAPNGKVLATAGTDRTAKLWDVTATKPEQLHQLEEAAGPVNAVAFSPDGRQLAVGTGAPKKSGRVRVYDVATGKPSFALEGHEDVVTCVVFHPKTDHLASGGADNKIRVWDLAEKKTLYTDEHSEALRTLVIGPDGERFGSCSATAVRWWAGFGK